MREKPVIRFNESNAVTNAAIKASPGAMASEYMAFFESMLTGMFQSDDNGRRIFYPWGPLARGYEMPDGKAASRIMGFAKISVLTGLVLGPTAGAIIVLVGWVPGLSLLAACLVFHLIGSAMITRTLTRSPRRGSLLTAYRRQFETIPIALLLFVGFGGCLAFFLALPALFGVRSLEGTVAALALAIFGVILIVHCSFGLWHRWFKRSD